MFAGFGSHKKLTKKDLTGKLPDLFALREEWVEIADLGSVLVREMCSGDRDEWEWMLVNRAVATLSEEQRESLGYADSRQGDPRGLKRFLIARCVIDPATGFRMFGHTDSKTGVHTISAADYADIDSLRPGITELLYLACMRICGLTVADHEDAKKNCEQTPALSDVSTSLSDQEPVSGP